MYRSESLICNALIVFFIDVFIQVVLSLFGSFRDHGVSDMRRQCSHTPARLFETKSAETTPSSELDF